MCKRRIRDALVTSASGTHRAEAYLHEKGCMGASQTHIDIVLARDPCGLRELLARSGHCVRASHAGGEVLVDLSGMLGFPCTIVFEDPGGFSRSRLYLMATRSGALYVSRC
ncbi:MAG: hypothetical protein F7C38_01470 [Desulfurococcales archaeon]|nr:hypothetical protein [Desulfurococcales archaeon]